jgi:hypothetical protein
MKIRNGFVSNSSTSSFVVVTTKKAWDDSVAKLSELGKLVVKHEIGKPKAVHFLGKDLIALSTTISTEEFGCNIPNASELDPDGDQAYEEFGKFSAILRANKDALVLEGD